MNKAFLAGLVIGFVIGYAMRQERVTSTLTTTPAIDWPSAWWDLTY